MKNIYALPALKYSIILSLGIIMGSSIPLNRTFLILLLMICCLAFLVPSHSSSQRAILCYILVFITGFAKSNIDSFDIPIGSTAFLKQTSKNETVRLQGVVNDLPDYDSARIRFTFTVKSILAKDTINTEGEILVNVRRSNHDTTELSILPGDFLELRGSIVEPPGRRNDGEFDYRKYLFMKGIYKIFRVYGYSNVKVISGDHLNFLMQDIIYPAKNFSIECIENQSVGDEAQFLKGLVTGDRSDIGDDVRQAFMDAGVSHLIAVSGLNVAYLILSLTLLCSLFRMHWLMTLITIMAFLIFYCLLTGSTASIIRASVMGGLILISARIQRIPQFYNILGLSACLILLCDTRLLFDAGFILSFAATISMVWIYEKIDKHFISQIYISESLSRRLTKNFLIAFFTTFAAQVGTLPVTAMYFGKISIISLLVNIVAVPLANLSLAIGFMQISMSVFSVSLASYASETNNILLSIQLWIIKFSAGLPGSSFYVKEIDLFKMAIIYFGIIFTATSNSLRMFVIRFMLALILTIASLSDLFSEADQLEVTALDVGQGDCIVIRTPDDKCIIVDCGNSANGYDSGERTLAPYLRRKGISIIDILILTHNHADHIGGAQYITDNFDIRKIIYTPHGMADGMAGKLFENARTKHIELHEAKAGDIIDGFRNMRLYFLFPDEINTYSSSLEMTDNLNNSSVVLFLKYKETEILFTGDIETEAEKYIARKYGSLIAADVLKSAHHGSNTSSTPEFLSNAEPDAVLISCGQNNKFGHPSSEVIQRYKFIGTNIFRTDRNGGFTVRSDGKRIEIEESYYR